MVMFLTVEAVMVNIEVKDEYGEDDDEVMKEQEEDVGKRRLGKMMKK